MRIVIAISSGFSEEFVPLIVKTGRSITIIRHDLESGEETVLLSGVEEQAGGSLL